MWGKTGFGPVFPRDWGKTNRILEQAHIISFTVLL
jgi:hypothetical protein